MDMASTQLQAKATLPTAGLQPAAHPGAITCSNVAAVVLVHHAVHEMELSVPAAVGDMVQHQPALVQVAEAQGRWVGGLRERARGAALGEVQEVELQTAQTGQHMWVTQNGLQAKQAQAVAPQPRSPAGCPPPRE